MKNLFILTVLATILITCRYASIEMRKAAQHDKRLYDLVMSIDQVDFVLSGGGPLGYENYYKWCYAKWINDENRTWFEKIMFWNTDIFYVTSNPPEEYQYPFLGTD